MSSTTTRLFERRQAGVLEARLREPRRFLQVVAGARQVGKTTLVEQVLDRIDLPAIFISADEPTLTNAAWLDAQWNRARLVATDAGKDGAVLALDEVQKIPGWSETVKRLWDEDSRARRPLKVVLLGSAPLLMQQGLTESLAGRFEVVHLSHWSFDEMRAAFGFTLEQYIYFGGYPGAAPLIGEPQRWRRYLLDALIETTIARDVLLMARVTSRLSCDGCSNWGAAIPARCCPTPRCLDSCRMRATPRRSRTISSSSRARGCWPASRNTRAAQRVNADPVPSYRF